MPDIFARFKINFEFIDIFS